MACEDYLSPTGARQLKTDADKLKVLVEITIPASYEAAEAARDAEFDTQFLYSNGGNWTPAIGTQVNASNNLVAYEYPDNSGNLYGVKGSVALPINVPAIPDTNWFLASAVNLTKMRTDMASKIGLVYVGEWSPSLSIPGNANADKKCWLYSGVFITPRSNYAFTTGLTFNRDNWYTSDQLDMQKLGIVKGWGALGNANFRNPADSDWYEDEGFTILANDDTLDLRVAFKNNMKLVVPIGGYKVTGEIEVIYAGQVIEFETTGGYGYAEDIGLKWQPSTRFIACGTFPRRQRTRRIYRGSASDPYDAPLSCVLNVQAEGVVLTNVCVWLNVNYADYSPTNFGDDIDIGIFYGCRVGVQITRPYVIGFFRQAGMYFDVTGLQGVQMPLDLAGVPYDPGTVTWGADGTHMFDPYIRGPKVGLFIAGARPKAGETGFGPDYVDYISGQTVPDKRGTFGTSDFLVIGGRIYGPDHMSNWRWEDPIGYNVALNETTLMQEPDNAPACMYIDGLAGLAGANKRLQGMRFIGTRFATFAAFIVRIGYGNRITFYSTHIENRTGGRKDASGNIIDVFDYDKVSYGRIAGGPDADRVMWFGANINNYADAYPHLYGRFRTLFSDSGDFNASTYSTDPNNNMQLIVADGKEIQSTDTAGVFHRLSRDGLQYDAPWASAENIDLRHGAGKLARFREGSQVTYDFKPAILIPYNQPSLGGPSNLWSEVFAVNPVINTSDERYKTPLLDLSKTEKLIALELKSNIKKFKFLDAVEEKGNDKARLHFGVSAQFVKATFEKHGLNGFDYGLLCHDTWKDDIDRDGNILTKAGDKFGIRYAELSMFILASI